jgi:hypothetical protein
MLTVVGNGTYVDVTFSAATHFLAGDKLDLRTLTTKKANISSASSTSTTFTINTATAHGLIAGDSVTVEGASLAGYNGVFTVATAPTTTQLTITNAANPGAMGAVGTVRLTTPGSWFDDLGLATIASMESGATVARITSAITGPAANPVSIGGDPGVDLRVTQGFISGLLPNTFGHFSEANAKALPAVTATIANATGLVSANLTTTTAAAYTNDWTNSKLMTWNAGAGTNQARIKQIGQSPSNGYLNTLLTFNTPVAKSTAERLRITFNCQMLRELI